MHELFSDWYQVVDPTAPRETLEKRWAATEQCLEGLTSNQVAELATYVALVQPKPVEWFRALYKHHDDVMKTRGVDEELRLLAAVVLRISLEDDGDLATLSALCLLTGAFGRSDQPAWLGEHVAEAARVLASIGRVEREFKATLDVTSIANVEEINGALSDAVAMINTLRELNDFLWWAFARYSATLGEPYSELSASTLAVAAPIDLIALSRTRPLPAEAETLLFHVVASSGIDTKYSLKTYIGGLTRPQAQRLIQSVPEQLLMLCPVLWTLRAAAEGKAWQTDFERRFNIKTSTLLPVAALTVELLREVSITKTYGQ